MYFVSISFYFARISYCIVHLLYEQLLMYLGYMPLCSVRLHTWNFLYVLFMTN